MASNNSPIPPSMRLSMCGFVQTERDANRQTAVDGMRSRAPTWVPHNLISPTCQCHGKPPNAQGSAGAVVGPDCGLQSVESASKCSLHHTHPFNPPCIANCGSELDVDKATRTHVARCLGRCVCSTAYPLQNQLTSRRSPVSYCGAGRTQPPQRRLSAIRCRQINLGPAPQ